MSSQEIGTGILVFQCSWTDNGESVHFKWILKHSCRQILHINEPIHTWNHCNHLFKVSYECNGEDVFELVIEGYTVRNVWLWQRLAALQCLGNVKVLNQISLESLNA